MELKCLLKLMKQILKKTCLQQDAMAFMLAKHQHAA
jgi:hypothetical protein